MATQLSSIISTHVSSESLAAFSVGGRGHRGPKQDLMLQAIVMAERPSSQGELVYAVALPWYEITREIKNDPDFLYRFTKNHRKFEEYLAGCYTKIGYEAVLTPQSGDLGIDIIVTASFPGLGKVCFVDQAKAYSPGRLVSADDVRAMAGVLLRDSKITKGIITTTSSFAPGVAKEFGQLIPTRLELRDKASLLSWLKNLLNAVESRDAGESTVGS